MDPVQVEPSAPFTYDAESGELKENRPNGTTATNVSEYTATAAMIGAVTPGTVNDLCEHVVGMKAGLARTIKDPVGRKHAEYAIEHVMGALRVAFPMFSGALPPVRKFDPDAKTLPTKRDFQ